MLLENGWLVDARHVPSPHHDCRPEDEKPTLLVVHNISLPPGEFGGPWIDALFANTEVPVALIGTSYSANPNWNFVGALKQALRSDVINDSKDGHGPILPMLAYLKSDAFKNTPPQVLIWEFPERYLPVDNEIGDADPSWVATLKEAGARQPQLAQNTAKSETPNRAQH